MREKCVFNKREKLKSVILLFLIYIFITSTEYMVLENGSLKIGKVKQGGEQMKDISEKWEVQITLRTL